MAYLYGTSASDRLFGTVSPDTIYGTEGNDSIDGLSGSDILYGGVDHDRLVGVEGADPTSDARPRRALERFRALPPGSVAMSVITYGELVYGTRKSPDPEQAGAVLDECAALIPSLPINTDAARSYGKIRDDLSRRGELIGNDDLWIAAHALSLGLTLVTNNEGEFRRVVGLQVENWALP